MASGGLSRDVCSARNQWMSFAPRASLCLWPARFGLPTTEPKMTTTKAAQAAKATLEVARDEVVRFGILLTDLMRGLDTERGEDACLGGLDSRERTLTRIAQMLDGVAATLMTATG